MKRLVTLVATAILMFGASAAVSWMLTRQQLASAESTETAPTPAAAERERGHQPASAAPRLPATPAAMGLHPVQAPGAEETVQLAANLRNRLAEVKEKETRLDARQKHLDLVYKDIRDERVAIEGLHKQILEEIKKAPKPAAAAEQHQEKAPLPLAKTQSKGHGTYELLPPPKADQPEDIGDLRLAAKLLANEPPELTAKLFEKLAATGKTATAVKLLAELPEKQAAKVLSNLPDSKLAAELLERAKESKRLGPQSVK
jgi:flagellar motility protein MotE (MotC chaperone)